MLRIALVAAASLGFAASASCADRIVTLDDALRAHADALSKPIVCGKTPAGDRWRLLKFKLPKRHLVFAELVRERPDGSSERLSAGGFELFNEEGARHLARGLRCEIKGGLAIVSARAVDDRNGRTYRLLNAELTADGEVIEYLGPIVVGGGK
jgi:hypothetical protein